MLINPESLEHICLLLLLLLPPVFSLSSMSHTQMLSPRHFTMQGFFLFPFFFFTVSRGLIGIDTEKQGHAKVKTAL